MSRLTGNDAYGMMEAYNAVYQPRTELTEEQVWEEVETWVNSLIEEGYDLSEYTWEDMYESYINEDLMGDLRANAGNIARGVSGAYQGAMRTASNVNQAVSDRMQRNIKPKPAMPGLPPSAAQPGGPNSNRVGTYTSRFAGARDAAFARAKNIKGSPVVGTGSSPAASAPAARPAAAAPAARPAAAAPAAPKVAPKPAAATPAPAATPSASPARPSLSSQADEIRQMRARSLQRQGKTLDAATVSASTKPAYQANSFDLFDVVLGHLLDEGYADTEEAALKIMANMSEEWKSVIIGEERAEGVRPYKAGPTQAEVRADAKKAAQKKAEKDKDKAGYGPEDKFKSDWKLRAVPSSTSKRKDGEEETVSQRMNREKPYATRPFSPLFTKQGSRTASAVTRATEGPGEPQSVTMPRKKSKPSREIIRRGDQKESYDYILSHLIYEGYANTVESAEAIISNMSEDWILSIIQ